MSTSCLCKCLIRMKIHEEQMGLVVTGLIWVMPVQIYLLTIWHTLSLLSSSDFCRNIAVLDDLSSPKSSLAFLLKCFLRLLITPQVDIIPVKWRYHCSRWLNLFTLSEKKAPSVITVTFPALSLSSSLWSRCLLLSQQHVHKQHAGVQWHAELRLPLGWEPM